MEPITFIVTALTLGIAAGLKPIAEQAIKDAYSGLKILIENRYKISLSNLESNPKSNAQIAAVKESLSNTNAGKDDELIEQAKKLFDLAKKYAPETAKAEGINFKRVKAGYIKAKEIIVEGLSKGVEMDDVTVEQGIEIENVKVRNEVSDPNA